MLGLSALSEAPLSTLADEDTDPLDGEMTLGHGALSEGALSEASLAESGVLAIVPPYRRGVFHSRPWGAFAGRTIRRNGVSPPWVEYSQTYRDAFRIADSAYDRYELYVGYGQPPDFEASGQPVATSPTFPFQWTPTLPSSGDLAVYCVVRKRSKYNLVSFNVYHRILYYVAGVQDLGPVTAPRSVVVYDNPPTVGSIRTIATYIPSEDAYPADTWELYVKFGSDPVPGVDTPAYEGLMSVGWDLTNLNQALSGYTPGTVARVVVSVKRASDSRRASAAVVLHTLHLALEITEGGLFGGNVLEQL